MVSEFARFGRYSMRLEISRRGAHQALVGTEFMSDQAWIGQRAASDRHINTLMPDIDNGVGQGQIYLQVRIEPHKDFATCTSELAFSG
ncbi:hypothetical protein PMA3_17810 [Pseudomonas silesiensis]|uniref:Uncharacterized protein n=1 Tax=Pseudomonas silesiensis TaxID=1853130 RepID=A0A191YVV6_9PSED|nr:hypothetical protein PMA3_17810 [Pseudomonas silesiensis]